ncbi:MAG: ion channel [Steroidobacteraceae bacterium]
MSPQSPVRNLINGVIFVFVIMALGTSGYVAAGWKLADALYMVIITIFSVGYEEVHPVQFKLCYPPTSVRSGSQQIILYPESSRIIRNAERMRDFGHSLHNLGLDLAVLPVAQGSRFAGLTIEDGRSRHQRAGSAASPSTAIHTEGKELVVTGKPWEPEVRIARPPIHRVSHN